MIEKLLRLQQRFEPVSPPILPSDKAGELQATPPPQRPFRRIILFSPAFGESAPGEEFPPWLIPAKLRPPDVPQWKEFCRVRSELTEDDLLDDDPFARCLRPCLLDPRRLELLCTRKDLRPRQVDSLKDSAHIELLMKRRDLYPEDIRKMGRKIRSALVGRVPARTESKHAAQLTGQAVKLLGDRPDVRPEHLTSMLQTMRRTTENKSEVDLPKMFSAGMANLQGSGATVGEARQKAQADFNATPTGQKAPKSGGRGRSLGEGAATTPAAKSAAPAAAPTGPTGATSSSATTTAGSAGGAKSS